MPAVLPSVITRPVEPSETLPLNKANLGRSRWSLCGSGDDSDGLNLTIGFFTIFTIAVTVALVVQLHYEAFEAPVKLSRGCSLVWV